MQKARALFRVKPAASIASIAKCHLSTAERWDRGERDMDVLDLIELLGDRRIGPEVMKVFWDHIPKKTRDLFLHQLEAEQKARAKAERRRQLRAELDALETDQPELGFVTR